MMKTLEEIKDLIKQHELVFKKKYGLKSIAIFGSYSRGDYTANSDIDFLVEFNDAIGIKFIDFANELERLLNLKVDLVSKKGVQPKYLNRLEEELIYV